MAYKALRVPIALLHQKVYPTGYRLDHWTGLAISEKPDISRVISPTASSFVHLSSDDLPLFDRLPYLRRYYYYLDIGDDNKVVCRGCGTQCDGSAECGEHKHSRCWWAVAKALREFSHLNSCVICEAALDDRKVETNYCAVPVCDDNCMFVWERMNPDNFVAVLRKKQEEGRFENVEG